MWATWAAAIAAKSNFKDWVNGGRSSQQRAASAASAASWAEAVQAARPRPLTPVRFRGSTRLEAAQVTVGLRIGAAGAVSVVLNCLAHSSEELDAAVAAADSIPSGIWELFFARCKAAKLNAGELPSRAASPPRAASHVQCASGSAAITTLAQLGGAKAGRGSSAPQASRSHRAAAEGAAQRQRSGVAAREQEQGQGGM